MEAAITTTGGDQPAEQRDQGADFELQRCLNEALAAEYDYRSRVGQLLKALGATDCLQEQAVCDFLRRQWIDSPRGAVMATPDVGALRAAIDATVEDALSSATLMAPTRAIRLDARFAADGNGTVIGTSQHGNQIIVSVDERPLVRLCAADERVVLMASQAQA